VGCGLCSWFACDEPLHQAEVEALLLFDVEVAGLDVLEWSAQEMLAGQGDGNQFQQPLDASGDAGGAGDVVDQDQPPARTQHPDHLVDRGVEVRDGAQAERAHHRVKGRIGKRQRVRGALPQRHVAAEVPGAGSGEVEHPLAEITAPATFAHHGRLTPSQTSVMNGSSEWPDQRVRTGRIKPLLSRDGRLLKPHTPSQDQDKSASSLPSPQNATRDYFRSK
jgi:hypothetical protein